MPEEKRQPDWLPGERLIVSSVVVAFMVILLSSVLIVFTVWGPC